MLGLKIFLQLLVHRFLDYFCWEIQRKFWCGSQEAIGDNKVLQKQQISPAMVALFDCFPLPNDCSTNQGSIYWPNLHLHRHSPEVQGNFPNAL